jgi:hypothetical protein
VIHFFSCFLLDTLQYLGVSTSAQQMPAAQQQQQQQQWQRAVLLLLLMMIIGPAQALISAGASNDTVYLAFVNDVHNRLEEEEPLTATPCQPGESSVVALSLQLLLLPLHACTSQI